MRRSSATRRLLLLGTLAALAPTASGCEGALAIENGATERGRQAPPPQRDDSVRLYEDDAGPRGSDAGMGLPPGTPECTPQCNGLSCGDDGCGGTCGSCVDPELCTDGVCVTPAPQSAFCPPSGSEGSRTGDVVPDFDFPLVGGGRMSIRELCPRRTVLIYWLAEWCGYCRDWLRRDALPLVASLADEDFQLIVLVGTTYTYDPGDLADAERIQAEYDLDAPIIVGWEDADQFQRYLGVNGPQTKLLMIEGNELARSVGSLDDGTVTSVARRR